MYKKIRYIKLITGAELLGTPTGNPNEYSDLVKIVWFSDGSGIYLDRYSKFSYDQKVVINKDQIIMEHDCDDALEEFYEEALCLIVEDDLATQLSLYAASDTLRSPSGKPSAFPVEDTFRSLLEGFDVSGLKGH
jgi:hypothetical protein